MTRNQRGVYKWWWLKRCTTQNKPEDECMRWDLLVVVLSLYILIFIFYFVSWGKRDSYEVFADGFHLLWNMIIHIKNVSICTPWHYFAQGYYALLRSSVAVGSNADMLSDTLHPPGRVPLPSSRAISNGDRCSTRSGVSRDEGHETKFDKYGRRKFQIQVVSREHNAVNMLQNFLAFDTFIRWPDMWEGGRIWCMCCGLWELCPHHVLFLTWS